jgi:phage tail sheath gpL-like
MSISFDQIPSNLRVPLVYVEFNSSRAVPISQEKPFKILIVGQKTSAGTFPALTPQRVTSLSQAIAGGGAGSMLHDMARALFANNQSTEAWFVALADPVGGAAATKTVTFAGSPTVAGTVYMYVAGRRIQVPVATNSTPTTLAAAFATAITADTSLPVTAGSALGVTTLTAKHLGVVGNELDVRYSYQPGEALPAGITVTVAVGSAGTGDVDVATIWPTLGDDQYDIMVVPYTDATNLTSLEQELDSRWGPLRSSEGYAITSSSKNLGDLATLGNSRNNPHVSIVPAYKSPTPTWEIATAVGGQVAFAAQIDPARPFQTLPLIGVLAPAPQDRFTASERNTLLFDGISTLAVRADGTVAIERLITTYQLNSLGTPDVSYLDATTPLTLSLLRYDTRVYFSTKYPRHKVASNSANIGPGQAVITPAIARGEFISLARSWEERGLVENIEQFKRDLVVERNAQNPTRLDAKLAPDLVNPLTLIAAGVEFRL